MCLTIAAINLRVSNSVVDLPSYYFAWVIAADLLIRAFLCTLRAFEQRFPVIKHDQAIAAQARARKEAEKGFLRLWQELFFSTSEWLRDYWHPFIVGFFELSAFPYFIANGDFAFIGAWLAFKAIIQWKDWVESRSHFQRFLIGNALVIAASLALSQMLHPARIIDHKKEEYRVILVSTSPLGLWPASES